jgi:hypothetical protein
MRDIMGYGQHQSFYLRINWLRKALKHLNDGKFLYKDVAAEQLGLGKNMVQSLRYWVDATDVVNIDKNIMTINEFGLLLNKYDRFIEMQDTASIIHLHLTDDQEPSTTWYWYFNHCNRKVATKEELVTELIAWIVKNDSKKPSESSLKRDIDCLVRMYCDKERFDDPEEVIQSPLSNIGLMVEDKKNIIKRSPKYSDIGLGALMYCLLKYKETDGVEILSVEEIEKKEFLWGKVYNLQRNEIIKALEELAAHPYYKIRFDRTNRLDTIHLPNVTTFTFLEDEYIRNGRKAYVDAKVISSS